MHEVKQFAKFSDLILRLIVMKELSFDKMESIDGGQWAITSSVDAFCASFGIAGLMSGGTLFAVPGMQFFSVGCGGWTLGRAAGLG